MPAQQSLARGWVVLTAWMGRSAELLLTVPKPQADADAAARGDLADQAAALEHRF